MTARARPRPRVQLDCIEMWVGDLGHTESLLTTAFGFEALSVPAEHAPDEMTARLACGGVCVVLRQGASPESPIARHVALHGDTVGDVALACTDPGAVVERAHAFGLEVFGPQDRPTIVVFGDRTVCHSVRTARTAPEPLPTTDDRPTMRAVDHVTYCLPYGTTEHAAQVYQEVFGLVRVDVSDFEEVGGEAIGMRSVVLRSPIGFTVVLTEPSAANSTGQTQRFIDAHAGPGVQHAAIVYDDLIRAVGWLRSRGVEFLAAPGEYFDQAERRMRHADLPWDALRRLEILVDSDEHGLLFQLFTRPLAGRPTYFFEFIQRAGATGFGANNVKALFAAVQATAAASVVDD